jgi:hypothetical protein
MLLVLSIIVPLWLVATLLVVSLCRLAKQGDEAQAAARPQVRAAQVARPRGDRPQRARDGLVRR